MNIKLYIDTVIILFQKEFKVRYKNSILGYFWSVLNPTIYALTLSFVFSTILKVRIDNFLVFVVSVIFAWQWFANSITTSPSIFVLNSALIKKINFPKTAMVVAIILQDMLHFILSLPIVFFILLQNNHILNINSLLFMPFLMFNQFILIFGISLIISSINVFIRDIERITQFVVNFLFYISSIFFPINFIPEKYLNILWINPVMYLMENWRSLILNGEINWYYLIITYIYAILIMVLGLAIYTKLKHRFPEVL